MSTDVSSSLLQLPLQRKGSLPLHEQLRSAVEMAIVSGELPDGAALPSVRQLTAALRLSPSTVIRAYRDLEIAKVIRVVPKRGYFVIGADDRPVDPALLTLRGCVDQALNAALAAGLSPAEFVQYVAERVRRVDRKARRVAVIGRRDAALAERAAVVAEAVADLSAEIIPVALEDLEAAPNGGLAQAAEIDWFLVPLLETEQAARLLGPHAGRILPMTRVLRADVREFISRQPPGTRFGLVATTNEMLGRMLAAAQRVHPFGVPPLTALVDDRAGVDRVLSEADVLLIGSLARPRLAERAPFPIPSIELQYVPDAATLRRLRARLNGAAH